MNDFRKGFICNMCLELMIESIRTRCGHSFCKSCIGNVLRKKIAFCPLCKGRINKRNISKDDHMQLCIKNFKALVTATIEKNSHIDILSHLKQPRDMKESCPYPNVRQSSQDSNKEKSSKEEKSIHQSNQNASKQIDKPSTRKRHGTMIDCDNPRYDSNVSNKPEFLRNLLRTCTFSGDEKDNATRSPPDIKIHSFPDKLNIDDWIAENEVPIEDRARPISDHNSTSRPYGTGEVHHDGIASRRSSLDRKRSVDCPKRIDEDEDDDDTSSPLSFSKRIKEAKQIGEVIEITDIDCVKLTKSTKLKYSARLHPKKSKKIAKSAIEKTVNQDNSLSSMACDRPATSSSLSMNTSAITEQSTANRSPVIKFGKEMNRPKRKVKKLNVSTEKKKKLRIIKNIKLTPGNRFDLAKIRTIYNKDGKEANIPNRESNDGKQEDQQRTDRDTVPANKCLKNVSQVEDNDENVSRIVRQDEKKRSADEDDVVENTPKKKMKNSENNVKMIESRETIKFLSPTSRTSEWTQSTSRPRPSDLTLQSSAITSTVPFGMSLFSQSTLIAGKNSIITTNRSKVFEGSKKIERIESRGILLTKPVNTLENVRRQSNRQDLCFVCSDLSAIQKAIVKEFAAKYNANYVNQFNHDVTHVIVNSTDEQNATICTLKYLQGIAHRKWIVSYKWIEDCNRQQRLLDEVPYEATTQNDSGIDGAGPRNSRLRERGLFEGFTFLCVGPYNNVSLAQYQDLLSATGATVADSFKNFIEMEGIKGILIQDTCRSDETFEHWYKTAKAAPILVPWIIKCISCYKLLPFSTYILLSSKNCSAIGYPRELTEKDEARTCEQ